MYTFITSFPDPRRSVLLSKLVKKYVCCLDLKIFERESVQERFVLSSKVLLTCANSYVLNVSGNGLQPCLKLSTFTGYKICSQPVLHELWTRHKLWGSGFPGHDHCRLDKVEIPAPKKVTTGCGHWRHRVGLRHRVRKGKSGAHPPIRMGGGSGTPDGAYLCEDGSQLNWKCGEPCWEDGFHEEKEEWGLCLRIRITAQPVQPLWHVPVGEPGVLICFELTTVPRPRWFSF